MYNGKILGLYLGLANFYRETFQYALSKETLDKVENVISSGASVAGIDAILYVKEVIRLANYKYVYLEHARCVDKHNVMKMHRSEINDTTKYDQLLKDTPCV